MSEFAVNRGCNECGKIEVGLVELNIGKKQIFLCYDCMLKLCNDLTEFKSMNYDEKDK